MFKENVRYLRRQAGLSQQELADRFGYKSFTTIQKWEDGTSIPSYEILQRLAGMYRLEIDDLMRRDLTKRKVLLPVLGVVRGGEPIHAEENVIDYEEAESSDYGNGEYFYLEVVGDSMKDARILPGDRLCVHRQDYLENNEIGVVLIDNEATVKYVHFAKDKMILSPANAAYAPIEIDLGMQDQKRVRILGRVVHNKINF